MGRAAYGRALPLALAVILLDQASKWWILALMDPPRQIEVTPFFNLVLAWNRGVSFSLFHSEADYAPYVLSAVAAAVVIALLFWLPRQERLLPVLAIGLIIGGALGNVIDRLRFGAVVDFLDVHAAGWHWPAFNLADSAITLGVVGLLADGLFGGRDRAKT
jgi:signal peptidase II